MLLHDNKTLEEGKALLQKVSDKGSEAAIRALEIVAEVEAESC